MFALSYFVESVHPALYERINTNCEMAILSAFNVNAPIIACKGRTGTDGPERRWEKRFQHQSSTAAVAVVVVVGLDTDLMV